MAGLVFFFCSKIYIFFSSVRGSDFAAAVMVKVTARSLTLLD